MKKFIPLILILCYVVYLFFMVTPGEDAPNTGGIIICLLIGGGFIPFNIYYNIQDYGKWYKFPTARRAGLFIMLVCVFMSGLSMLVELIKWHIIN